LIRNLPKRGNSIHQSDAVDGEEAIQKVIGPVKYIVKPFFLITHFS
jgi:hypothetical protein